MFKFLLAIFIGVPIFEMYLLIQVGGVVGAPVTILLVLATAVIGAYLARREGIKTLFALQKRLAAGEVPGEEVAEGALLLLAAALLITPGFFTDAIGFACVLPFTRKPLALLALRLATGLVVRSATQRFDSEFGTGAPDADSPFGSPRPAHPSSSKRPEVIEGEYRPEQDSKRDV